MAASQPRHILSSRFFGSANRSSCRASTARSSMRHWWVAARSSASPGSDPGRIFSRHESSSAPLRATPSTTPSNNISWRPVSLFQGVALRSTHRLQMAVVTAADNMLQAVQLCDNRGKQLELTDGNTNPQEIRRDHQRTRPRRARRPRYFPRALTQLSARAPIARVPLKLGRDDSALRSRNRACKSPSAQSSTRNSKSTGATS